MLAVWIEYNMVLLAQQSEVVAQAVWMKQTGQQERVEHLLFWDDHTHAFQLRGIESTQVMPHDNGVCYEVLEFLCDHCSSRCATQPLLSGLFVPFRWTEIPLDVRLVAIQECAPSIADGCDLKNTRAGLWLLALSGVCLKVNGDDNGKRIVRIMAQRGYGIPVPGIVGTKFFYFLSCFGFHGNLICLDSPSAISELFSSQVADHLPGLSCPLIFACDLDKLQQCLMLRLWRAAQFAIDVSQLPESFGGGMICHQVFENLLRLGIFFSFDVSPGKQEERFLLWDAICRKRAIEPEREFIAARLSFPPFPDILSNGSQTGDGRSLWDRENEGLDFIILTGYMIQNLNASGFLKSLQ